MSLSDMLNQTITIKNESSYNEYGEETYGDSVEYSARINYGEKYVQDLSGNMFRSIATIYIEGDIEVYPNSYVLLPDSNTPYKCQASKVPDRNGDIKYTKLRIGSVSSVI